MTGRRLASDDELGGRLAELGGWIEWPVVPDLSARVIAAIEAGAPQPGVLARLSGFADVLAGLRRAGRRSLLIALIALLAIVVVAAAIGLGVPGIRIELRPLATASPSAATSAGPASGSPIGVSTPPAATSPGIALGLTVTLGDAQKLAGFGVLVPTVPGFGSPTRVHLLGSAPRARVSLEYGDQVQVTEFLGAVDPEAFQKILSAGSTVERVNVGGTGGYWIAGAPHELSVLYRNADGTSSWEVIEVTGNVLIWQAGQVTLRLQTTLDRDVAVDVASSAR